jgi:hypothetical protein
MEMMERWSPLQVPYDAPIEHLRDALRLSATIDGFGLS